MQAAEQVEREIPDWVHDLLQDENSFRKFWVTKGLGSGGTYGSAVWHYAMCMINSRSQGSWAVAPTFTQVLDPLIPTYIEVLRDVFGLVEGRDFKVTVSAFPRISFPRRDQIIYFKSASNPERLVGANISHASGTEIGLWKSRDVFNKVFNRIRCAKANRLQFLGEGSPEGMNWWADVANFPEGENLETNSRRIILETDDNPYLPDGYVRNNLELVYAHDPVKLESYRKGLFVSFTKGTAYWNYKDRYPVVNLGLTADPVIPLAWCWDFNRTPLAWVTCQKLQQNKGRFRFPKYRALHESSGESRGLLEACAEFIVRYPVTEWGTRRIEIYGDASGYAGSDRSELCDSAQIERYMRSAGYRNVVVLATRDNPDVRPRLERVNALLAYDMVEIAAHCNRLRSGLTRTALKEGTWEIEKPTKDTWTHYPDAFGYGLYIMSGGDDLELPAQFKTWGLNAR